MLRPMISAVSTPVHVVAIGMTIARSYLRVKKDHVWWDDRLTVMGAMMDLVFLLSLWLKALNRKRCNSGPLKD